MLDLVILVLVVLDQGVLGVLYPVILDAGMIC
jgi:hypothetical protein